MTPATLTQSRLACFRACPRRHYLRYELGIATEETSFPLRVGTAFHAAHEARANGQDVAAALDAQDLDPFDAALVAAMFDAHERRWASEPIEAVAAELAFDVPVRNPDTGASSPLWRLRGVIDRIVRLADGRLALLEMKTTSQDFSPGADYWMRLHLDLQLSLYVVAAREMGHDVRTVLYDVTRRPALRPLKATPSEARKFTRDGRLYANQRDRDETPEEYAARVAEAIAADPDRHFARIEIARLDQDLDAAIGEVWEQQQALRSAQLNGRWYRNPEACYSASGHSCDYLPICGQSSLSRDGAAPHGFRWLDTLHPELDRNATKGGEPLHASAGQAAQSE